MDKDEDITCLSILKWTIGIIFAVILFAYILDVYSKSDAEHYTYELQEIENGIYAISYDVKSAIPAQNYSVIKIQYGSKLHSYSGTVAINFADSVTPYADIMVYPHLSGNTKVTIYVPSGSVEYQENISVN